MNANSQSQSAITAPKRRPRRPSARQRPSQSRSNSKSKFCILQLVLQSAAVALLRTKCLSSSSFSVWALSLPLPTLPVIHKVVIAGGTHGNEYTGVWCIQHLAEQQQRAILQRRFPSLQLETLLANPEAFHQNRRFVDTDLNREFISSKLQDTNNQQSEAVRARQLNELLGPKHNPNTDLIIDLHSTTSSMGITIIVSERDDIMAQGAAYVLQQLQKNEQKQEPEEASSESILQRIEGHNDSTNEQHYKPPAVVRSQILMHAIPDRMQRPNLGSVARHAFTIEVGPVPQGVLRHDAVTHTLTALYHLLDFVEHRNQHYYQTDNDPSDRYLHSLLDYYSRPPYRNGCVPCFRSAPAVAQGELSGKIPWPSHPTNPNFPAYMIHEALQDREFARHLLLLLLLSLMHFSFYFFPGDFELVRTGDPLFIDLVGNVISYRGSHGDAVYLMFINEGGYYYAESGTGIGVAVQSHFRLRTGTFTSHQQQDEDDKDDDEYKAVDERTPVSDIGNFE